MLLSSLSGQALNRSSRSWRAPAAAGHSTWTTTSSSSIILHRQSAMASTRRRRSSSRQQQRVHQQQQMVLHSSSGSPPRLLCWVPRWWLSGSPAGIKWTGVRSRMAAQSTTGAGPERCPFMCYRSTAHPKLLDVRSTALRAEPKPLASLWVGSALHSPVVVPSFRG